MSKISMEEFATQVVDSLSRAGHTAFFAGGCVRDKLLGVSPKDFDVATSALPEQVRDVFGRKSTLAIGESFGVITVLGPKPHQVEVATFRNDGEYTDGRHPDGVTFSSAEEDAQRRDFTINGMFYDPIAKEVIDYVDGQADLGARLIRAIGSAAERINEDRLRMLRAVRFAATYSFEIEQDTLSAIQELHEKITSVSQERITHELQRMLCHRNRSTALELLKQSTLLSEVLPNLASVADDGERWTRLLRIASALSNEASDPLTGSIDASLAFATLFGAEGAQLKSNDVTVLARKLKLSNDERKTVEWITKHYATLQQAHVLKFSELQPLLVSNDIRTALSLLAASADVDGIPPDHATLCLEKLAMPVDELNPAPLVRGEDLAAAGLQPGPEFAKMLKQARDAQLNGEVDTKNAALELIGILPNS